MYDNTISTISASQYTNVVKASIWSSASVVVILCAIAVSSLSVSVVSHKEEVVQENAMIEDLSNFGKQFKEALPPGTLIAACNVGALCYYSELPTIDMMGLTDVHIAHYGNADIGGSIMIGHNKHDAAYVLSLKPEYIVFDLSLSQDADLDELWPAEKEMILNQEFIQNYQPTGAYCVWKRN